MQRENSQLRIALLTSGGDSQGMNAAIKAIVRVGLSNNAQVYAIFNGYQGLLDFPPKFKEMKWNDVAQIISEGGTILKTARCSEFKTLEGRTKACKALVEYQINILIVLGGDGSLTGANALCQEWDEHIVKLGIGSQNVLRKPLVVAGLAASIDNDIAGTTASIGAFSSLHRIVEAIQCIQTTASSHMRCFVVEVMGRSCGWLALMASVAVGSDFVFVPEQPVPESWKDDLICVLKHRLTASANQMAIVIVGEGATDSNGRRINCEEVRATIENNLQMETRVTSLGHLQRGGITCAYDRYLGIVQGAYAVEKAIQLYHELIDEENAMHRVENKESGDFFVKKKLKRSFAVGIKMGRVVEIDLDSLIIKTQQCNEMLKEKLFSDALAMRSKEFQILLDYQFNKNTLSMDLNGKDIATRNASPSLLVIHNGAPAGGMNAAVCTIVHYGYRKGYRVFGCNGGFPGLISGDICQLTWSSVEGWMGKGGCCLGTSRVVCTNGCFKEKTYRKTCRCCHKSLSSEFLKENTSPFLAQRDYSFVDCHLVKDVLEKLQISGLIVIGGFEGLVSVLHLKDSLSIPTILLPTTLSNNIPFSDWSVGCDTALNVITDSCDVLKQSAASYRSRLFIVDVQGGNCGFLSTVGALCGGAALSWIEEEGISLQELIENVSFLKGRFAEDNLQGRIVIRNENCSSTYTSERLAAILESEAANCFDVRYCVLGHLQQGGCPSPFDRILAVRMALSAVDNISREHERGMAGVICVKEGDIKLIDVAEVEQGADMEKRRPKDQWWLGMRQLQKQLTVRN